MQASCRPSTSLRHAACRPESALFSDRCNNHPTRGLRPVSQAPKADRGRVRMGENRRSHGPDHVSRRRTRALALHSHHGGQQPRPTTTAAGGITMKYGIRICILIAWNGATWDAASFRKAYRSAPPTSYAAC